MINFGQTEQLLQLAILSSDEPESFVEIVWKTKADQFYHKGITTDAQYCQFLGHHKQKSDDAAYHDMVEMFGYKRAI